MADQHSRRGTGDGSQSRSYREPTGIPRWVLIVGVVAALVILLIVVAVIADGDGGGGHGPRRHGMPDGGESYSQSALVLPYR